MSATNPQIKISYSDDGGYNWSNPRYISIGKLGAYSQVPVRARSLGQGRNRVFKVEYTEPTPFSLFGAELDLTIPKGTT